MSSDCSSPAKKKPKASVSEESTRNDEDTWTWHFLLSRQSFTVGITREQQSDKSIVPIDPDFKESSLGWILTVYRLKKSEQDKYSNFKPKESGDAPCFFPTELAKQWTNEDPTLENRLTSNEWSIDECLKSPRGVNCLLQSNKRQLLVWNTSYGRENHPVELVKLALECLQSSKWDFDIDLPDFSNDDQDCNANSDLQEMCKADKISKQEWIDATKEKPTEINLYLDTPLLKNKSEQIMHLVTEYFPNASCATLELPKQSTSDPWPAYLLWLLLFSNQTMIRLAHMNHLDETPPVVGDADMGVFQFWGEGKPIRHLFPKVTLGSDDYYDSQFYKTKMAYLDATRLLQERPWKTFAPFEALKITLRRNGVVDQERWVHFVGDDPHSEGETRCSGPLGTMEIFDSLGEFKSRFGRQSLFAQMCGPAEYADRPFVTAETFHGVHPDAFYILDYLFSDSSVPKLPDGIIPVLEAETGPPKNFPPDETGRRLGRRRLSQEDLYWLSLVGVPILQFIREEGDKCKPSDGERTRSYGTFESSQVTVSVSYNMDRYHGGLWDPEVKWMWF